jgi:hypothetical protein
MVTYATSPVRPSGQTTPDISLIGQQVDTLIINVKGKLASDLDAQLETLKEASQEADDDVPTSWTFAGETLYIKSHGSGRQWRWILHCPSLHLDLGRGRMNGIVGTARLASACLWEQGVDRALALLYTFVVAFFGESITLQVSEAHLCCDVAGWDITLADAHAFLTRAHRRASHLVVPETACPAGDAEDDERYDAPPMEANQDGRRCTGFEFSKGAPHSAIVYDKSREISVSRKDWMRVVWSAHGWDSDQRVWRVEFRYKRECLHEMDVEEPYAFLDQLPGLWAYSTQEWLRHTVPTADQNRGRWPVSPAWQVVQRAGDFGQGVPAVRERRRVGDLTLICQMLAGCSTKAAALLTEGMPAQANAADFLTWFYDWMESYYRERGLTFEGLRDSKRLRLGVIAVSADTAA